ncbi:tetratricopeptide repeat protein [Sulfitobacter pacificus]
MNKSPDWHGAQAREILRARPDLAIRIRNEVLLPLKTADTVERAAAVNAALIVARPWSGMFRVDQLDIGLLSENPQLIDAACTALPGTRELEEPALVAAMKALLRTKQNSNAVKLARALGDQFASSVAFAHLALKALYRDGEWTAASEIARTLSKRSDLTVNQAVEVAIAAQAMRNFAVAEQALVNADVTSSDNGLSVAILALCSYWNGRNEDDVVALAEQAAGMASQDARTLAPVAETFSRLGRTERALEVLQNLAPENVSRMARSHRATLLAKSGDYAAAAEDFAVLSDAQPENSPIRRRLVGALVHSGQLERAQDAYAAGLVLRRPRLGDSFADALGRAIEGTGFARIPEHRFRWCETHLDIDLEAHPDWRVQAQQTTNVDNVFVEWAECYPDRIHEMFEFVNVSENAQDLLQKSKQAGKGGFVASAHVGVLYAGPVALELLGLRSSWIASMPSLPGSIHEERLISTETSKASMVIRSSLQALAQNHHIAVAIDGAAGQAMTKVPFLGHEIEVSDFCARVAFKTGCTTFVPTIVWTGERVEIDLVPLPEPLPAEGVDAFAARWIGGFTCHLEETLSIFPQSIRGAGGFWRNISTD